MSLIRDMRLGSRPKRGDAAAQGLLNPRPRARYRRPPRSRRREADIAVFRIANANADSDSQCKSGEGADHGRPLVVIDNLFRCDLKTVVWQED